MQTLLTSEALAGLVVTSIFAVGAYLVRGVTPAGALAGFAIALAIFMAAGPGAFAALVAVFAVTWTATRLGYHRKQRLGLAENARGRSAAQVFANLGAAAAMAVIARATGNAVLLVAAIAALAEAAADTAASECGEALSETAYLITTLRPVAAGTDGGISAAGTLAGAAAATIVGIIPAATHVVPWHTLPAVIASAVVATLVDSLLGATLERRGIIGNNGVNFASTVVAAGFAVLLWRMGMMLALIILRPPKVVILTTRFF